MTRTEGAPHVVYGENFVARLDHSGCEPHQVRIEGRLVVKPTCRPYVAFLQLFEDRREVERFQYAPPSATATVLWHRTIASDGTVSDVGREEPPPGYIVAERNLDGTIARLEPAAQEVAAV